MSACYPRSDSAGTGAAEAIEVACGHEDAVPGPAVEQSNEILLWLVTADERLTRGERCEVSRGVNQAVVNDPDGVHHDTRLEGEG